MGLAHELQQLRERFSTLNEKEKRFHDLEVEYIKDLRELKKILNEHAEDEAPQLRAEARSLRDKVADLEETLGKLKDKLKEEQTEREWLEVRIYLLDPDGQVLQNHLVSNGQTIDVFKVRDRGRAIRAEALDTVLTAPSLHINKSYCKSIKTRAKNYAMLRHKCSPSISS